MANLRTNNLSGEGGRNAYRGSVFFDGQNTRIEITASSDLALGSGDYTIEAWVRFSKIDTYQTIIDFRTNNGAYPFIVRDTDGDLYYFVNGSRLIDNMESLQKYRFQKSIQQLEDYKLISEMKKENAKINTILKELSLNGENN